MDASAITIIDDVCQKQISQLPAKLCVVPKSFPISQSRMLLLNSKRKFITGVWRNGSASDSRSEGWEFESLWARCG